MEFPPGLGETDSMVNLDESIGKWVGRVSIGSPQTAYAKLLQMRRSVSGSALPFPRGVFRFKTHEQADEWTQRHILQAAREK